MLRRMEKHDTATPLGAHQRKGEFRNVGENLYRYSSKRPLLCGLQSQGQADLEIAQNQRQGIRETEAPYLPSALQGGDPCNGPLLTWSQRPFRFHTHPRFCPPPFSCPFTPTRSTWRSWSPLTFPFPIRKWTLSPRKFIRNTSRNVAERSNSSLLRLRIRVGRT